MSGNNPLDAALNHDVLLEIGKRAAANALSTMIDVPVMIDITDVNVMPPDKVQGTTTNPTK